ncbi:MAG: hypothetical protein KDC79_12040 [Cyclobacteriaceae bacterium]|nr:hypothetical protein [Cyclobacteriaceae bacterium]
MNKRIINSVLVFLFVFTASLVNAQEAIVQIGVYRGKNLFIQNPYDSKTKSYCVQSVEVNGNTILSSPNSSALTVDLSGFEINQNVQITIFHKSGCVPKVLNPRVLQQGTGFQFVQTLVDDSSISWITTGEQDKSAYYEVEKLKLDDWRTIQKVKAKGDIDNNQYSVGVVHYSGDNEFRIHYLAKDADAYSETFNFYSAKDPISFYPIDKVDDLISLTEPTDYIIKTKEGVILKKGVGQDIFVDDLKPGEYIIVIENREEEFYKPEPVRETPLPKKKKRVKNDGST